MYKNINKNEVLGLAETVDYQAGQVVSKTLVQNELMSRQFSRLKRARKFHLINQAATQW